MKKLSMDELGRTTVEGYKSQAKIPVVIVLDNIRSMNNVGSVFRTSDAFSVEKIWLCGITATPPHKEITKTALGATESVGWQYCESTPDLVSQLKTEGYTIYAVEQTTHSIDLQNFSITSEKIAVILGNEVFGVDDTVLSLCDGAIEIPQEGIKHSLNVSVAAGIVIWELFRKFKNLKT